jgi:hypothetical protein
MGLESDLQCYNGGMLCAMALKSANGRQNTTQKPGFLCAESRR